MTGTGTRTVMGNHRDRDGEGDTGMNWEVDMVRQQDSGGHTDVYDRTRTQQGHGHVHGHGHGHGQKERRRSPKI